MPSTRWLNHVEDRAWRGLNRVQLLVFSEITRDLQRDSALSVADYDVLSNVSESAAGRWRFGDLAARMRWSTSRLSHHIDRMVARGLVERVDRADDGRGSDVILTELGRATIEAAAPPHVESVRRHLFDHLSPEQVAQLADITETLLAHHDPAPG